MPLRGVILPELSSCPSFFGKLTSFCLQHLSDPLESEAQSWSSPCPMLCPGCTTGEHRLQTSKTEHTCGRLMCASQSHPFLQPPSSPDPRTSSPPSSPCLPHCPALFLMFQQRTQSGRDQLLPGGLGGTCTEADRTRGRGRSPSLGPQHQGVSGVSIWKGRLSSNPHQSSGPALVQRCSQYPKVTLTTDYKTQQMPGLAWRPTAPQSQGFMAPKGSRGAAGAPLRLCTPRS